MAFILSRPQCVKIDWLDFAKSPYYLSPVQIHCRTNADILSTPRTKLQWNLSHIVEYLFQENATENVVCRILAILLRPPYTISRWRQMETFSALLALCAGNHRSPVNSRHKGQWRGALIFSLICARINAWENNREAGDFGTLSGSLWRHCNDTYLFDSWCRSSRPGMCSCNCSSRPHTEPGSDMGRRCTRSLLRS